MSRRPHLVVPSSACATLERPEPAEADADAPSPERAPEGEAPPEAATAPVEDCRPFGDVGCGTCPACRRREARLFDDLLAAHLAAIERQLHPEGGRSQH